jgi:hypothetical protein
MKKRRGKWIDYFDLVDTLKIPGCLFCNRIEALSLKFLDNLFYEQVTDAWTRVGLRKAKGFCNWHAWVSTEIANSNSGIAMIYKDLLDAEINQLSKWAKIKNPSSSKRALRLWERDRDNILDSWKNKSSCPICESINEHERIEIHTLLDFIDEEAFSQEFEKSSGICMTHLMHIIQTSGEHPNLSLLVEKQLKKYQFLSEELGEFIRKLDYRFSEEPKGSEVDSWKRVLEQFAGKKGVFGSEMGR